MDKLRRCSTCIVLTAGPLTASSFFALMILLPDNVSILNASTPLKMLFAFGIASGLLTLAAMGLDVLTTKKGDKE